jgi:hypothetical protein
LNITRGWLFLISILISRQAWRSALSFEIEHTIVLPLTYTCEKKSQLSLRDTNANRVGSILLLRYFYHVFISSSRF